MNTSTISLPVISIKRTRHLPATARGSAMYTIDWFLNGQPSSRNHDNPSLTIKDNNHA
ncbi:MAG: hypothetical protein QNL05_08860 [Gammaproteobacteria bacterium]|nr:hypothetical protein [Gammaproteobacteria bacterium]MDX2487671.1 hypothetical protein [Gammaproteobacteria bacterium]